MQRAAPAHAAHCVFRTGMMTSPSHPVPFLRASRFGLHGNPLHALSEVFPSPKTIRFSIFRNPPHMLSEDFFFSGQYVSDFSGILFTRIRRAFLPQRQSASSSSKIRLSRFRRILLFLEQSVSAFPEVPSLVFRHRFPKTRLRIHDSSEA